MYDSPEMKIIAHIENDYGEKFGIPRQAGLANGLSRIVFEPEFRREDAVRGLAEFSHLWIIWQFSENVGKTWSPTVRPPRLGGNRHVGVFATRSPFRPNPIGLSCVRIEMVEPGPVIWVRGADLMDGTPIYDWRWISLRHCWRSCRRRNGCRCWRLCPRTQDLVTRRIRNVYTGCAMRNTTSGFGWRAIC